MKKGIEKGAIVSRRGDIIENLNELGSVYKEIVKRISEEEDEMAEYHMYFANSFIYRGSNVVIFLCF